MVLHKIIVIIITDQATDGSYCDAQTIDIDLTTGIFLLQQKHQKQTWRQSQTPDTHQATVMNNFNRNNGHRVETQVLPNEEPEAVVAFLLHFLSRPPLGALETHSAQRIREHETCQDGGPAAGYFRRYKYRSLIR